MKLNDTVSKYLRWRPSLPRLPEDPIRAPVSDPLGQPTNCMCSSSAGWRKQGQQKAALAHPPKAPDVEGTIAEHTQTIIVIPGMRAWGVGKEARPGI